MLYEIQIVNRQPIDCGNKCEIRRNIWITIVEVWNGYDTRYEFVGSLMHLKLTGVYVYVPEMNYISWIVNEVTKVKNN